MSKRRSRGPRFEGLAEGLAKGLVKGLSKGLAICRALERAEVNERLKKRAVDNAEKLHTVKCSLLKIKVLLYRAQQRASRHLHVQQPDGSSAPAQMVAAQTVGKRCSIEKQIVVQEGSLQGRSRTVGNDVVQIGGNEYRLREFALAFLQDCDLGLGSRKKRGTNSYADQTRRQLEEHAVFKPRTGCKRRPVDSTEAIDVFVLPSEPVMATVLIADILLGYVHNQEEGRRAHGIMVMADAKAFDCCLWGWCQRTIRQDRKLTHLVIIQGCAWPSGCDSLYSPLRA